MLVADLVLPSDHTSDNTFVLVLLNQLPLPGKRGMSTQAASVTTLCHSTSSSIRDRLINASSFSRGAKGYVLFLTATEAVMALDNPAAHRKGKENRDRDAVMTLFE